MSCEQFFSQQEILGQKNRAVSGRKNTSSLRVPKKQNQCVVTDFGSNQPIIGHNSLFDPKKTRTLIENVNTLQLLSE